MKYFILILFAQLASAQALVTIIGQEGTTCSIKKIVGTGIEFVWGCTSEDGKVSTAAQFKTTSTVLTNWNLEVGQSVVGPECIILGNPTSAIIVNGLGSVPANGIYWTCNSGNNIIVNGSTTW